MLCCLNPWITHLEDFCLDDPNLGESWILKRSSREIRPFGILFFLSWLTPSSMKSMLSVFFLNILYLRCITIVAGIIFSKILYETFHEIMDSRTNFPFNYGVFNSGLFYFLFHKTGNRIFFYTNPRNSSCPHRNNSIWSSSLNTCQCSILAEIEALVIIWMGECWSKLVVPSSTRDTYTAKASDNWFSFLDIWFIDKDWKFSKRWQTQDL